MKDANYWRAAINKDSNKTTWGDCHEAFRAMVALYEWIEHTQQTDPWNPTLYLLCLIRDGELPEKEGE